MKPRSVSPVAAVNSTSNVIRSSVRADRVGHHRRRLGEHLALASHALGQPRRVRVLAEAHGGLGARRLVGRAVHRLGDPDLVDALRRRPRAPCRPCWSCRGGRRCRRSWNCPARRPSRMRSPVLAGLLAAGDPRGAGADVDAGLEQRGRARRRSATAGCSSRRRAAGRCSASMSLVAVTPVGSGQPASSAASTPTLSAPCAYTPTSSMSSRPMMACSERLPMLPVVHWITRSGRWVLMHASSLGRFTGHLWSVCIREDSLNRPSRRTAGTISAMQHFLRHPQSRIHPQPVPISRSAHGLRRRTALPSRHANRTACRQGYAPPQRI